MPTVVIRPLPPIPANNLPKKARKHDYIPQPAAQKGLSLREVASPADLVTAEGTVKMDHPLAVPFKNWLGNKTATRRQASKFLSQSKPRKAA